MVVLLVRRSTHRSASGTVLVTSSKPLTTMLVGVRLNSGRKTGRAKRFVPGADTNEGSDGRCDIGDIAASCSRRCTVGVVKIGGQTGNVRAGDLRAVLRPQACGGGVW